MKLSQMFENTPGIEIVGLYIDSRCVKANDMYFCMEGMVHDGYEFTDDIIEKGVKCIVHFKPVDDMKKGVAYIQVENVNRTLNRVASTFYGHSSHKVKVFGVTGTDGRSTTTSIIRDAYPHSASCGYVGAISISYEEVTLPPSLIMPDAVLIHRTMKDMVEYGMQAVASEVSSHGLELGYVQSTDSDVVVFSNLIYDHLDSHGTIERCLEAKKKLFTSLEREGVVVLNADDAYVDRLAGAIEAGVTTCGIDNHVTHQAENIRVEKTGLRLTLVHGTECCEVSANPVALYNVYNLLGAVALSLIHIPEPMRP